MGAGRRCLVRGGGRGRGVQQNLGRRALGAAGISGEQGVSQRHHSTGVWMCLCVPVCVCACVCVGLCACVYACMHLSVWTSIHVCMCVPTYACACMHVCVSLCAHTRACVYICAHMYTCVRMHVCVLTRVRVCTCVRSFHRISWHPQGPDPRRHA